MNNEYGNSENELKDYQYDQLQKKIYLLACRLVLEHKKNLTADKEIIYPEEEVEYIRIYKEGLSISGSGLEDYLLSWAAGFKEADMRPYLQELIKNIFSFKVKSFQPKDKIL